MMDHKEYEVWMAEVQRRIDDRRDPLRYKILRLVTRIYRFFRHGIWRGTRNLILFFPVIWEWRSWDYSFDYEIFMRAIELHKRALIKFHYHTNWERDVNSMDLILQRWRYLDANPPIYWDEEDKVWGLMHDHLRNNARNWWD